MSQTTHRRISDRSRRCAARRRLISLVKAQYWQQPHTLNDREQESHGSRSKQCRLSHRPFCWFCGKVSGWLGVLLGDPRRSVFEQFRWTWRLTVRFAGWCLTYLSYGGRLYWGVGRNGTAALWLAVSIFEAPLSSFVFGFVFRRGMILNSGTG